MNRDNAIEKSLFDKNIESLLYNPNLVINEYNKNIKDKIIQLLVKNSRVDIAVSYSVWSGLSLIYKYLKKFNSDSRMIVTIEGLVTDPQSLRKLNELDMSVKVYAPSRDGRGFHLKTYMFESAHKRTLLIGSSNISSRAFGLVHEMAVEIDANEKGYIVEEYNEIFESLWNDEFSDTLTKQYADNYAMIYKEKQKTDKKLNDLLLNREVLKPNYMQKKALAELEDCRKVSNRGLVIAATGTGKTYLSAFDIENFHPDKVLFLVHNRLILTDAIKSYKKIFANHNIIELTTSNADDIRNADFIFTTDKTAYKILHNKVTRDYFDYIVYDEAHKIGEDTNYYSLINYFEPKFTLGITATPERTKNPKYLFEVFQYNVPYEIRLLDSMNYELICPFTYYGYDLDEKLLGPDEEFNYPELAKYIKELINDKGHHGQKLKGIVFCKDKKETLKINEELNKIGYISKSAVSGKDGAAREEVERYITSLKSDSPDSIELICVVNKFNEGVDIPDINTIIMLRNTTSSIVYLQQLGRGLRRTYDPHKFVTIFDIIGNSNNNYSIAEVLTGNTTTDKRQLYRHANKEFDSVSPFINVDIEKKAMEKIVKSISNNFTVKTRLKEKYKNELYRFKIIPSLKELYLNKNFNELELLQLLYKNFYDPFDEYYDLKYGIEKGNTFVSNFFKFISQFIFRAYSKNELQDYARLLKGNPVQNRTLAKVLCRQSLEDGISTAIYTDYYKKNKENPTVFVYQDKTIKLHKDIISRLKKENAYDLFLEHIELIDYLALHHKYTMNTFDLVDKGEFLYNIGSKDCYLMAVGERIDHSLKRVYCPIQISKGDSPYDNKIVGNDLVLYHTQSSATESKAIEKDIKLINQNYTFYICAQFPHLGYSNTSYFNLGPVNVHDVSNVKKSPKGKFNHEIVFKLEKEIPLELLQYKDV